MLPDFRVLGTLTFVRRGPCATVTVRWRLPSATRGCRLMSKASTRRAAALCVSVAFFQQKAQGQNRAG